MYPQKKISSGTGNLSVSFLAKQVTHISLRSQTEGLACRPSPRQSGVCVSGQTTPADPGPLGYLPSTRSTAEPNISNNSGQEYPTLKLKLASPGT